MIKYVSTNIQWITDGYDVDLPTKMDIPSKYIDENDKIDYEGIEDYLSDTTGWLHNGFEINCTEQLNNRKKQDVKEHLAFFIA